MPPAEHQPRSAPRRRPLPGQGPRKPSAHFVGICGSGMKSLAELLLDRGWRITGSDAGSSSMNVAALRQRGVQVLAGHRAEHLPSDADVLVYSPAVPAVNPERTEAVRRGQPQLSYPQMLGRLMQDHVGVAVAGTHGKSTATAMCGWILRQAGIAPSVVCGAELLDLNCGGWTGAGRAFVVEACEYQRHFLELTPRCAAVLDIEPDHFDCFADLGSGIAAFSEFVRRVPSDGLLVARAGRPAVAQAVAGAAARVETFAIDPPSDWTAQDVRCRPRGSTFSIWRQGRRWTDATLRVPGQHNVLNALAAAALSAEMGAGPEDVRRALGLFAGLRRRFERLGAWRGIDLIDDYAHHPTAVSATLSAARQEFPTRRVWCAFQPHQISRTLALVDAFAQSLLPADEVIIPPVYAAREALAREAADAARLLVRRTQEQGGRARFVPSLDRLIDTLETDARPGDVVLLMGAGDIDRVRDEFARRIPRHHAS